MSLHEVTIDIYIISPKFPAVALGPNRFLDLHILYICT